MLEKCTILENIDYEDLILADREFIIFWIRLNSFINNTSSYVDEYVVRTLYPDTPFRGALYVDFEYENEKVIFERDNCACCFDGIILWSDNEFYSNWELKEKKEFRNKCYECNYVGE